MCFFAGSENVKKATEKSESFFSQPCTPQRAVEGVAPHSQPHCRGPSAAAAAAAPAAAAAAAPANTRRAIQNHTYRILQPRPQKKSSILPLFSF